MKKKIIGIMVYKANPLPLYEVGRTLPVDILVFNKRKIYWKKKKIKGFLYRDGKWREGRFPFPDVVYNRFYSSRDIAIKSWEVVLGKRKVFNFITKFDKWTVDTILRASPLQSHLPKTSLFNDAEIIYQLNQHGKLILKPCSGNLGENIYKLEKSANDEYVLYHHMSIPKISTSDEQEFRDRVKKLVGGERYLVQNYIDFDHYADRIYDLRIYIQKNRRGNWEYTGGFCRTSYPDSYITNQSKELLRIADILAADTKTTAAVIEKIKKFGIHAAKLLEKNMGHLGELGFDFAVDTNGKVWIIEVNGRTQKHFLTQVDDERQLRNIYLKPLEYAYFLAAREKR
ncbi:YheC/D like ATP-grasp [Evansella caseinilytica]|uniref:YheC/D like ATP-grasp n=1 Tax=Evansella caseinilytica TaxID=1503961 RepID=A0A1H3HQB6_9BACI|nr:YheC/YheD family protein [Evansella caseinilytica]SDY16988.1 YheC/D like ATP-grasp [Evansella caseinilytica]